MLHNQSLNMVTVCVISRLCSYVVYTRINNELSCYKYNNYYWHRGSISCNFESSKTIKMLDLIIDYMA